MFDPKAGGHRVRLASQSSDYLPLLTVEGLQGRSQPPVVMGTVRQSTATSALTRCLSPTDMGQGHWSRVGLARRLCCAAHCQGGQLVDRKTAKGYVVVGSGARRRPDVAES
ncbi:hypothetical protein GW17_00053116 [Ensete ventricosum]|nr:hypothetical protein GW17_00053116 [Ensete ventricosum]